MRKFKSALVGVAVATGLWVGAADAHAAVVTDDFNRTSLGSGWSTYGGGQMYLINGQISAAGEPSEPISFAFSNSPVLASTQEVSATVHWNGRSPLHSSMSVALRANPATHHAGVHFWFTANLMGIAMYNWQGTEFIPATGTAPYISKWMDFPEGTRITLKAVGNTYTAYASVYPFPLVQGTFTSQQAPLTNAYGGVHGEDDSSVSGGGEPPANLGHFQFSAR
ncbi:hypothetical protein [Nocardia sp. R7R-8]|uniref:hypothetical protein n=1 Tax=Nocardia sp. R7R-8 TaxID=3459304 RepID=UPI00403DA280